MIRLIFTRSIKVDINIKFAMRCSDVQLQQEQKKKTLKLCLQNRIDNVLLKILKGILVVKNN